VSPRPANSLLVHRRPVFIQLPILRVGGRWGRPCAMPSGVLGQTNCHIAIWTFAAKAEAKRTRDFWARSKDVLHSCHITTVRLIRYHVYRSMEYAPHFTPMRSWVSSTLARSLKHPFRKEPT
jgi:hypothetical protein